MARSRKREWGRRYVKRVKVFDYGRIDKNSYKRERDL